MHEALRETLGGQPAFLFQRVQHRLDLGRIFGMRRQLAGQFGARMLAARQIAHGAHLQRRPLALGLAAIGLRTALLPVAARPIAVRSIVVPHIVAGALAIRPGLARAGADALLGRALPFVRRGGGLGGAARVGAAAQALRLGHGLELVIQLGAQMLGGFGGRFPAHGMKCRQENDNGRFPNQEPAVARLPYTPGARSREPGATRTLSLRWRLRPWARTRRRG